MPAIFISYRRIDTQWAAVALRHHITKTFPDAKVFQDIAAIRPGEDVVAAINNNVDQCQILLAVIGPNWLTVSNNQGRRRLDIEDDPVRLEIARALERDIRVIPVLVDGADRPSPDELPNVLKPLTGRGPVTVNHDSNDRDFDFICDALERELSLVRTPAIAVPPESRSHAMVTQMPVSKKVAAAVSQALLDAGTDPKTMLSVARLAHERGDEVQDEAILAAALPLLIAAEGQEDKWVLTTRHNLAFAVLNQGRAAEAEAMLIELLADRTRVLGSEHPGTLTTRSILARAFLAQGRFVEAEELLLKVLDHRIRILGEEHPESLNCRHELARVILACGYAAKAEALFAELLADTERVKGIQHPHTLTNRVQLSRSILRQGRPSEVEAALIAVLRDSERVKGKTHWHTFVTRTLCAEAVLEQGRVAEAEAMLVANLSAIELSASGHRSSAIYCRLCLARAMLELGLVDNASETLGQIQSLGESTHPSSQGFLTLLRAWIADGEGRATDADSLIVSAEESLAVLDPAHFVRRMLAKYRETRAPGQLGGTTLWMLSEESTNT